MSNIKSQKFKFNKPQQTVQMQELWKVIDDIAGAYEYIDEFIGTTPAPTSGGVTSVTDDGNGVVVVDNTNPSAPVVQFAGVNVDGVTITGDGTGGNPLVAVAGGGSSGLQDNLMLMGG